MGWGNEGNKDNQRNWGDFIYWFFQIGKAPGTWFSDKELYFQGDGRMVNFIIQDATRFFQTGAMSAKFFVLIMVILILAAVILELTARRRPKK